jgi:hypothetical protein
VARIAGLLAIAAVGTVLSVQFSHAVKQLDTGNHFSDKEIKQLSETPLQPSLVGGNESGSYYNNTVSDATLSAFRAGITSVAILVAAGGVISLIGIRNPERGH